MASTDSCSSKRYNNLCRASTQKFENDFESVPGETSSRSFNSKDRGKTWNYHETVELMKLWGSDELQEQLRTTLRNHHVYEDIAARLAAKGYGRTADQCRCKIKGMKLTYRRLKQMNNSAKAQKAFPFYRLIGAILSRRPPPLTSRNNDDGAAPTPASSIDAESDCSATFIATVSGSYEKATKEDGKDHSVHYDALLLAGSMSEDDQSAIDVEDTDFVVNDDCEMTCNMPLSVKIENVDEDDDNNDTVFSGISKAAAAAATANRHSFNESPPGPPSPKRVKYTKAMQQHVANRLLTKFMRHEEHMLNVFLEAENSMMTRLEQMEQRRMKFERELAAKQHHEDSERFQQLLQALTQTPRGPPRMVYMQEVNPPNWTA